MFFHFWILKKYAVAWRKFFDVTILLTISGIAIGVAVLVMAMSSFSGFETTLKRAIVDVVGDVAVYKRGGKIDKLESLEESIQPFMKSVHSKLYFLTQESLVSSQGKISAVLIQGVEKEKTASVLNLKSRIVAGEANWASKDKTPAAFLGKDLMKKLGLKIGDTFKVVMPRTTKSSSSDLNPLVRKFYVAAAVDLGKYDFNSRFLFVDLPVVQEMLNTKSVTGIRYKLKNSDEAENWAQQIQEKIGWGYAAVDWRQTNRNYLTAIEYEKSVIFFVVLIIVVAACFNVATTLFVTVLKRYRDISLLKTLGARPRDIVIIFCLHGLFLGVVGLVMGLALGVAMCLGFEMLQTYFQILPADIYKLTFISTELRLEDLVRISFATMLICFLSTLIPSIRGSKLSAVEGLKYE